MSSDTAAVNMGVYNVFIIFHWGGGQLFLPARWLHNMAPRVRMLSFSQQLCRLHSSIAVKL